MGTPASTSYAKRDIISKVANVLRDDRATVTHIEPAVARAGVDWDKVTAEFGSMHGLILEMVSDLSAAIVQPLERQVTDRTVRDVLIEFGNRFANAYSVSHLVALYRIALTEATRHSDIAREFLERGPGKLTVCLAQYLEYSAQQFSQLRIANPRWAAENFLKLLRDDLETSDAMTAAGTSFPKNHNDAVVEAVELFFHGIVGRGRSCKPLKQHTPTTQIDTDTISEETAGLMRIKDPKPLAS